MGHPKTPPPPAYRGLIGIGIGYSSASLCLLQCSLTGCWSWSYDFSQHTEDTPTKPPAAPILRKTKKQGLVWLFNSARCSDNDKNTLKKYRKRLRKTKSPLAQLALVEWPNHVVKMHCSKQDVPSTHAKNRGREREKRPAVDSRLHAAGPLCMYCRPITAVIGLHWPAGPPACVSETGAAGYPGSAGGRTAQGVTRDRPGSASGPPGSPQSSAWCAAAGPAPRRTS